MVGIAHKRVRRIKPLALCIFLFFVGGVGVVGAKEEGRIYKDHTKPESLLFQFIREDSKGENGNWRRLITYSYPDGEVAVIERLELTPGGDLVLMEREQKQVGEKGSIRVGKEQIEFSYTKNGKETKSSEKRVDNLVVGGTIALYIRKHWDRIVDGKILETRFGVIDRVETLGFEYQMVREEKFEGKDVIVVRMKPANFIVAALVDPLYFTFAKADKSLRRIQGRVVPKLKKANKFVDLDADFIFL